VEKTFGWGRETIRKGQQERDAGEPALDGRCRSGRKKAEEHCPRLLDDIVDILDTTGQTDPTFRSTRIYTPITAREVRRRLLEQKGYTDGQLIGERSLRTKLNMLGYRPQRIRKCKPHKRLPETDAIFEEIHRVNAQADEQPGVLRLSLDTKTTVKVGPFSRGGKSRCPQPACDHDFDAKCTLTPFGILLPKQAKSYLWFAQGKVTADFMVDRLEELWKTFAPEDRPHTLVINADNGPENSSRRTQWMKRLTEFSDTHQIRIRLAYYPPYHSKYNPVERLWGVLENHWRGELLDSVEKTLGLARSMAYKGIHPVVRKVKKSYKAGVSLSKQAMRELEKRFDRKPDLESWFVTINPITKLG
ncbi:MAG TPA: ISAzo13 family transposase, partial [Myxococcales bacterium]|nr:ISAzo13 family transposase [Myxococcales bacterium]